MKPYKLIYSMLLLFFIFACTPYVNIVSVDTLIPPSQVVNLSNRKVAIIGNLYNIASEQDGGRHYLFDSVLMASTTQGIKGNLEESPIFEGLSIPIYYSYSTDSSTLNRPMQKADLDSLAKNVDADVLISVEYVGVNGSGVGEKVTQDAYLSCMELSYQALFRTYDITLGKLVSQVLIKSNNPEIVYFEQPNGLPAIISVDDARQSLATRLGADYGMRIAPYWENVERVYYLGPDDNGGYLTKADRYAQTMKWQDAVSCWDRAPTSTNKTVAAMAAFNLALGCEMMGDLELAKNWLEYCKKLDEKKVNPDAYLKVIVKRVEDKKELDARINILDTE